MITVAWAPLDLGMRGITDASATHNPWTPFTLQYWSTLRAQLADMRRQLVDRLAAEFTGGDMALLATVHHALAGVEAEIAAQN
jgi:hypothetical protein